MNNAPSQFNLKRLKYTVTLRKSRVDSINEEKTFIGLENIESWTGKRINQNELAAGELLKMPAEYTSLSNTFEPGDVLFGKLRPYLAKALVADFSGCSTTELLVMKPTEVESRFLLYICLWRDFIHTIDASTYGSKMPRADWNFIGNMLIPVPERRIQRKIADFLDRETSRIDSLINAKERTLELLNEKRRALITRAVTKGLDPSVPMRDSRISWLGEIPAHWETRRIAWLFKERDQREEPELPLLEVSIRNGVVLREFSDERIESTASDFNMYKVAKRGDVVFNKMRMWQGAVGICPEDGLVSPDYVVAGLTGPIDTSYAGYLFRIGAFSAECARRSHGIVWDRLRLYWEEFREIEVPLPPLQEQLKIVAQIKNTASGLDRLSTSIESTIKLLRERRSALISAAVTGQIDVGIYDAGNKAQARQSSRAARS